MAKAYHVPGEIDWLAIKTEYVTSTVGYRQLADKYGVSRSSISRHAMAEDWAGQRDRHRDTIERRVIDRATDKIADTLAESIGDQAAVRVRIRSKLLAMAEAWIDQQDGQIHDAGDYRRIVQCCMDMLEAADSGAEQRMRVIMDGDAEDYSL